MSKLNFPPDQRPADQTVEASYGQFLSKLKLVSKTKIKLWHSLLAICFFVGFMSAVVWMASEPKGVDMNKSRAAGTCDVSSYGAIPNDSNQRIHNRQAIQAAIDDCQEVVFSGNNVYHSGNLELRSNVTLNIQSGATLKASNWHDAYTDIDCANNQLSYVGPLIHADNIVNVNIKGGGRIEGSGSTFYCPGGQICESVGNGNYGPILIWWGDVSGGNINDVWLGGSIVPTIALAECDNIIIDSITIKNDSAQNTDGIDIFGSQDITIKNSDITAGDDVVAIMIRSPWGGKMSNFDWEPVKNITIENNRIGSEVGSGQSGQFMVITWWVLGEVSDVYWKNNIIKSGYAKDAFGIYQRDDIGGIDPEKTRIHHIYYENNKMEDGTSVNQVGIGWPVFDCQYYGIYWNGQDLHDTMPEKVNNVVDCGGTVILACAEQGGDICAESETCSGSWLTASDSNRCCSVECQTQVSESINVLFQSNGGQFVEGSPTVLVGDNEQPWDHANDGIISGWGGTVTADKNAPEVYAIFSFDGEKTIDKLKILTDTGMGEWTQSRWMRDFRLQISTDGVNFTTVVDDTRAQTSGFEEYQFSALNATHIKLIADSNYGDSSYIQIGEIEVYTGEPIVETSPEISLTKSSDKSQVQAGEEILYTINYENIGDDDGYNIIIKDQIPAGTSYVEGSASTGGSYSSSSNKVSWNIGTAVPTGSGSVSFRVLVDEEPVSTCADGTAYGQCSTNQPQYCDSGSLVNKCSECGCPSGYECQGDGTCAEAVPACVDQDGYVCSESQTCPGTWMDASDTSRCCSVACEDDQQICADGTAYGQCSTNQPQYCDSGSLVNKCSECGCPSGRTCRRFTGTCR